MLIIGLVSGSVLAVLLLGAQEGNRYGFGSGLKAFFSKLAEAPVQRTEEKSAKKDETPKPKLDFYTVLPKIERIIPDEPETSKKPVEPKKPKKVWYVLQAASYTNFNEADRLKAQLTISGFDATVQKVTIDKGTYFRVRLGPYSSQRELKNVRQKLEDLGITGGLSLKVTEP